MSLRNWSCHSHPEVRSVSCLTASWLLLASHVMMKSFLNSRNISKIKITGTSTRDFSGGPVLSLQAPSAGCWGSISGQVRQLRTGRDRQIDNSTYLQKIVMMIMQAEHIKQGLLLSKHYTTITTLSGSSWELSLLILLCRPDVGKLSLWVAIWNTLGLPEHMGSV